MACSTARDLPSLDPHVLRDMKFRCDVFSPCRVDISL